MKHLGDITKINGAEIEPVDVIAGGSPCQDLSVAGKRGGLGGERSGLFMEQIRIIKEMRQRERNNGIPDELCRPRFMVWENVPGAFSSNEGKDFQTVLTEIVRIVEPESPDVPMPEKWPMAGLLFGEDGSWSIAWRQHDAQYWGVAQRRKRIALVADFGGECAGEILFESEGLSGYSAESFRSWQRTAGSAANRTGATVFDGYNGDLTGDVSSTLGVNCGMSTGRNGIVLNDQGGNRMDVTDEVTATLRAGAHHPPCVMESAGFCTEHSSKSRRIGYEEETSPTLRAGVVPATVYENHSQDTRYTGPVDTAPTVSATYGMGGNNQPFVVSGETPKTLKTRSGCEGGGKGALIQENKSATLSCNNDQTLFEPCNWDGDQVAPTLTAHNAGGNQRMPDKDNFTCVLQPFGICSKDSNAMKSDNPHSGIYEAETARTLDGNGGNPSCNQGGMAICETVYDMTHANDVVRDCGNIAPTLQSRMGTGGNQIPITIETSCCFKPKKMQWIVRRLTPTECERLQGFPDGWTDIGEWIDSKGNKHDSSDTGRYKALGNSIAVGYANRQSGFWMWMMKRISAQYTRSATLGSLFDGIGGFPLAWEFYNGKGSARWASEIEEFCIAVTKKRFGEE